MTAAGWEPNKTASGWERLRAWFLLPAWVWMVVLFAAPFAIVIIYSLLTRGAYGGLGQPWTIENYQRLFDPLYLGIVLRSFVMAGATTLICLLLGFPLALFISRAGSRKNIYLQLVILPFWTSFLVRLYAWLFLLRDTGLINTALLHLGLIHAPLPLLYNDGAVLLGLVYGYLPFMVLPVYATLERLDPALVEAAADLGAKPWPTLLHVDPALVRARYPRRQRAGFHSRAGRVPDARLVGRRPHGADRQPGAEPVHQCARLAFRRGHFRWD